MKTTLLTILGLCLFISAFAQEEQGPLSSDRPGATNSALTVGKGKVQIQSGFLYHRTRTLIETPRGAPNFNVSGFSKIESINHDKIFTNQLRFGILSRTEFGVNLDFTRTDLEQYVNNVKLLTENPTRSELSKLGIALRQEVLQESKYVPQTSILINFNTDGKLFDNYNRRNNNTLILLLLQKSLSEKFGLSSNLGYDFLFEDRVFNYTLNIGYTLNSKISFFIETYGLSYDDGFDRYFDGGFAYLVKDNILLDFYAGWGFTHLNETNGFDYEENHFLLGTGISYRFD